MLPWLVENDDGSITVKFDDMKRPPKIDGTEVKSLTLREPTVNDQLIADKGSSHAGDKEVSIIANLTEQAPEAISGMTLKQYGRLQDAYAFFTG
jgi:hypothetical protein